MIDDNTFKKSGYVEDRKNYLIFHFVLFPSAYKTVKRGLSGDICGLFSSYFSIENLYQMLFKIRSLSFNNPLMIH